ncbi:MAG TPA: EpsI family protein [Candidatus Krumholzibacteria bacterium]|nr:EpsI family protein [Candidatus Krumholzibacteria bacterium]
MDRTRAQITAAAAIALFALVGNTLRAETPRAADGLELRRIHTDAAGAFTEPGLDAEFLAVLRARDVLYRTYTGSQGEPVWVFLGYFDRQKEGSQVHSPRHCYPGSGWNIESEPRWDAPWGGRVASLVVSDGNERRLVVYWYQLDRVTETDVLPLKLELTRRAVLRRSQDVVFASISTPVSGSLEDTMARLVPMARDIHAGIEQLYRERDGRRAGT